MSDEHKCPRCNAPFWHFTGVNTRKFECGSDTQIPSMACRYASQLQERIKLLAHELESAGVERGIAVVNEGIATNENTRLRERITRLESWINNLDEVLRYNGKDGQREWCGSEVGYLYQGQMVYLGGCKP